ncbi:hypothetical protein ACFODO_09040 [Acinetobacter sichuanensis]|uniref:Uncharacterized protein n=1 Tax=Acinetobacter sichuanensis TaxID=2136183 RepID=A0A371YLT2_9GAMM|nr:hypothetical protein [Acinetobacter sichuanensis]RFC82406.1 hypothetical protein C9E89_016460 [Acinetobacter sichuanensis]
MRNNIALLIFIFSLPAIGLYGLYIVLETYSLFIPDIFFSNGKTPILSSPISSIFKLFVHFCGIATWILIIPMVKTWCNNTIVNRKILTIFTATLCIGLSPFYPYMYSEWSAGLIIAMPTIIFGIYLITWHMNDHTNEKNPPSSII